MAFAVTTGVGLLELSKFYY